MPLNKTSRNNDLVSSLILLTESTLLVTCRKWIGAIPIGGGVSEAGRRQLYGKTFNPQPMYPLGPLRSFFSTTFQSLRGESGSMTWRAMG